MAQAQGYDGVPISAAAVNPIVMHQQPARVGNRTHPREKNKIILSKLGITETILGGISILLAIVTMLIFRPYYYYGGGFTYSAQGIWCGAFLIASGILGSNARKHPSVCAYNSNMAVSIIAASFMGLLMILSGIAAASAYSRSLMALHTIIAITGFAGMVITIIHSAYCCAGVCCLSNGGYQGTVMYLPQHQYMPQPQQMIQASNGQFLLIQPQPVMMQGYPLSTNQVTASPMAYQQGTSMPQQQVSYPSTSSNVHAAMAGEQEFQMQGSLDNPPDYTTLPHDRNA